MEYGEITTRSEIDPVQSTKQTSTDDVSANVVSSLQSCCIQRETNHLLADEYI